MKFLMLRGHVPQDRDPREICHSSIGEEDCIYVQLAYHLTDERTEVWYQGGKRKQKYSDNFTVRWIPNFRKYKPDWEPDVIWARGGFPYYTDVLERYPNALKVYYGAGKRYMPLDGVNYDVILVDTKKQQKRVQDEYPKARVFMWIKPAPDNLFYPHKSEIEYDVCYVAASTHARKNVDWVLDTIPPDLKMLYLGAKPKRALPPNVTRKRTTRDKLAREYCKCKVGVMPYGTQDSAPRAISEMLACGLPIVAFEKTPFWIQKYKYVYAADPKNFWNSVRGTLHQDMKEEVALYYLENLCMKKAVEYLRKIFWRAGA